MNRLLYGMSLESLALEHAPEADAPENPAIAHDRAIIAAQGGANDVNMLIYRRSPLPEEWPGAIPAEAEVVVFVINAWTIVRTLQDAFGQYLREAVVDSWLHHGVVQAA